MIRLRYDIIFENPESRIREYCEIKVYRSYDDKHSVDNNISNEDIEAANNLFAMIGRYDKTESKQLLIQSSNISKILSAIPNTDLPGIPDTEWLELRAKIKKLFMLLLSIRGIGLAKTTKILHLKRPKLIPVLDSFVIKFLLDVDISEIEKTRQVAIGLNALDQVRNLIRTQRTAFEQLVKKTSNLPIPLTTVRLFDILCWTAEKWDIRGANKAPYGTPSKSLLASPKSVKEKVSKLEKGEGSGNYVVYEDLVDASGPKVHHVTCFYYKRWLKNRTSTTTWHGPYETEEQAWKICEKISSKSKFTASKHDCVS